MSSHFKTIVQDFLHQNGVVPNPAGALYEDLAEDNEWGLEHLAYAIANYPSIPGILGNIEALAGIELSDVDKEREYDNRLTEFLGLWFVSEVLKEQIVAVEVQSPYRPSGSNKTCDLESNAGGGSRFYEVKDFSSEILTQQAAGGGFSVFNPGLPQKIKPWIEGYVLNCVEKGANFLVCRVPAWHVRRRPKLTAEWVNRIYPNFTVLSGNTFSVGHGMHLPPSFEGVYVVRRDEHLLMKF